MHEITNPVFIETNKFLEKKHDVFKYFNVFRKREFLVNFYKLNTSA